MVTFTNMHGLFYNFWYTTLQMNTNHTGKFTTLSACTSLTWWRNVDVTEIMPFTVHVTLSPCCIERRQEFIPPEMWPPNLPDLNLVDYSIWGILQERVYRSQTWCERVERTSAGRVWRLPDHTVIVAATAQWCSRLNEWVRVNGGQLNIFEPLTFCCVLFVSSTLVPVNVIDINMCKVLILCEMCYFCVWDFHTVWLQHNECVAGNSYAIDFGIRLWSCARKSMKICQYL